VGYGDFHPIKDFGKFAAIGIALTGLILTGIVVSIAVKASQMAFQEIYRISLL